MSSLPVTNNSEDLKSIEIRTSKLWQFGRNRRNIDFKRLYGKIPNLQNIELKLM
jgi:hypothetical protein